ncbi:MAG: shikimate dehydrogenase [Hyphomicrobiaceae bacterium]|nr:shikimate dehydrogenase [Hyphomicrobiaceae bacterium]
MKSTATRAACVIGWPAKHSRSPKMHGWWLKHYGIDGDYRIEEVPPEDFPAFVGNLRGNGYVGANITLPHKEAAFALTEPDERARAIGAANTLWYDNGVLRSTNTDVEGFIGALDASAPGWDKSGRHAVVIGAGGAGRAVVWGLLERGITRIHVVNRTYDRAVAMAERYGDRVVPGRWEDRNALIAGAGLAANATSLGFKGNPDLDVDLSSMAPGAVVADINYIPLETPLLASARRLGLKTSDGLDMLLYQAGRGFELWFGVRPQVTPELRELLASDLPKS